MRCHLNLGHVGGCHAFQTLVSNWLEASGSVEMITMQNESAPRCLSRNLLGGRFGEEERENYIYIYIMAEASFPAFYFAF